MSRVALALPLLTSLALSTAAAQERHSPAAGAIVASPAVPAAPAPVSVRILTLAWQEITIPARLAGASVAVPDSPRRFVLTWEPLPASPAESRQVADRGGCRTMRLVLVPCE